MAHALSKLLCILPDEYILAAIPYVDQISQTLVAIETGDEDAPAVEELLITFVIQKSEKIGGRPLWFCTYSFNMEYGTAWPTSLQSECSDSEDEYIPAFSPFAQGSQCNCLH